MYHAAELFIKQIIAFQNTSPVYKTLGVGALVCGEEIKLKYWNEETQEYEDKFPAGVTIGISEVILMEPSKNSG